jgi:hypothetical protein
MTFPYAAEKNFELGDTSEWDAETDTQSRLNIRSYRDLWRLDRHVAPWRGAYAMEVDLSVGTAEASLTENDDFDLSADGENSFGFYLFVSPDIVMANNDQFKIWQQLATATDEGAVEIRFTTAAGLQIGVTEATGSAAAWVSLLPGWHHVAVNNVIDAGVGNDGSLTLFLDGFQAAQITALDQGAITSAKLGVIGQDAGTTAGFLLFDRVIIDDDGSGGIARVYPDTQRFSQNLLLTKSGHAFVGPGRIDNIALLSGAGTDNVVTVYDTDRADITDEGNIVVRLTNTANNELVDPAAMPVWVMRRGCYVHMTGTNPRALVKLGPVSAYVSDGAILLRASRVV